MRFLSLLFPALLTGCIATGSGVAIPTELMQPCRTGVVIDVTTNAGLAEGVGALASTLKQCNLDKEGLRAWATKLNG